ncbi:MAG: type II/IV secretion system protein, partial [Gammaproteobacteria bacterium]|nr:type II/IV secretion system protein [Gammaproteobacteria bacterium]
VILGASDIHFEPVNQSLRVRFRVTGMLQDVQTFPADKMPQVIARLKLMARLDVTERRQSQNGRFKFPAEGRVMDLRVATLPLHNGESVVLRLLEFTLSQSTLTELGFSGEVAAGIESAISSQQGMILITGPTGSGKTTTLYSLLNRLNQPHLKLISIEDPVELSIPGINQIQVDEAHGITFAEALKSVLRQDPDVIMIGEIRDEATARLAAQAALTGHLVLSTLHTASAPAAITRLQNLGLPNYLISATLKSVLAQRLIRCICTECRSQPEEMPATAIDCSNCAGSGYSGRTTIAEFLSLMDHSIKEKVSACFNSPHPESMLADHLLNQVTLADDAQRLLGAGLTDDAEIFRVLGAVAPSQ